VSSGAIHPSFDVPPRRLPRETTAALVITVACVLGEIALFATTHVTAYRPPNVMAVTLALVAIVGGTVSFFGLRHQHRVAGLRALAIVSILLGIAGPLLFGYQSFQWRSAVEAIENRNIQHILDAARSWQTAHHGEWPESLDTIAQADLIDPSAMVSPVAQEGQQSAATQPHGPVLDYRYVGEGLRGSYPPHTPILAAYSSAARLGEDFLVAFADGRIVWVKEDDMLATVQASNAERMKLGLAAVPAQLDGYTLIPDATQPAAAATNR
jgi:type II secretory pathway pseudopilin PulG